MKYNAIIFTDLSDYFIPVRVHGAYSIAAHLRNHGYTVKVIDHQSWLWENHGKELVGLVESLIGPETIFIGFSSTFSSQDDADSFVDMLEDNKQFIYETYKENLFYGEKH
jgi:hypothetical protein